MFLVGLTGGIGSGKSTVAERLRMLGCEVIDADLAERFGPSILQEDGALDRKELARVAFADDEARADLDRITHPRIAARIAERIAQIGAAVGATDEDMVVVDHPLLIETGQTGRFDAVVVVLADEELRVRRLVEARGLDEADVRARIRAQVDDRYRREVATHLVHNDGSLEELLARVDAVHADLAAAAGRGRAPVEHGTTSEYG